MRIPDSVSGDEAGAHRTLGHSFAELSIMARGKAGETTASRVSASHRGAPTGITRVPMGTVQLRRRGSNPPRTPSAQPCADVRPAQTAAATAVRLAQESEQALNDLLGIWGRTPTTPRQLAAARALAAAFNMEFDKNIWITIGAATQAEVARLSARDQAHARRAAAVFRTLQANARTYASAPSCIVPGGSLQVSRTAACFVCITPAICRRMAAAAGAPVVAKVLNLSGRTSPIALCGPFFSAGADRQAETMLHEMTHLASPGLRDSLSGNPNVAYYGCPLAPVARGGYRGALPGLRDPADFLRIADAYPCFSHTLRENQPFFERRQRERRQIRQEVDRATGGGAPSTTGG